MHSKSILLIVLLVLSIPVTGNTQLKLPRIIRDSMILQRDVPLKIWGWATPKEKVTVEIDRKKYHSVADSKGKWTTLIAALETGHAYHMTIRGTKEQIQIRDILAGDVWICSGQSNMVHQMDLHSVLYASEIAQANYPEIRQFLIPVSTDLNEPRQDLSNGYWKWANPKDVLPFTAVGYFFARKIYEKYHVPIGIVNASVGGTPIESWISEDGFKDFASIQKTILQNKDTGYINAINGRNSNSPNNPLPPIDKGIQEKWFDTNYVPKGWHNMQVPGYWEDQGVKDLDGIVWYRKEIRVPSSMIDKPARLFLGRIVDADQVYVNGRLVGNTTYMYPQRRYHLAAGILHAGNNIITIRVQNNFGKGGFVPDKPYHILSGSEQLDLMGTWQFKVGTVFNQQRGIPANAGINVQNQPTALFNGMIAPIVNYACKGILWYQGESNAGKPDEYEKLQPALINNWRALWQNDQLPFLYVQLPGYSDRNYSPSESQWASFRESQLKTLSMGHTGMAVAIDLGEWNDIHPDRKKEVGERLALAAQKLAYLENDLVYSGPLFEKAIIENGQIRLIFQHIGSGLSSSDGEELTYFSIAGADKVFSWAKAKIQGNQVIVWNDNIKSPLYVRYAWSDNPEGANLINKEGLPASPFRTDK